MATQTSGNILSINLERLKERIISNMQAAGQVASGHTIQSMRVEIREEGNRTIGTLYGRPFFGALETGSKPWTNQYKRVPSWFAEIMGDWIEAKGLSLNKWAVAYKIMRQGSALYREGGRSDIYSNEIPKVMESIATQMTGLYDHQIREMIKINA